METTTKEKNYYDLLEVATCASQRAITDAYQKAKNAYSLDNIALYSILTKDECLSMLESIDEAYTILGNPEKRRQYDLARGINQNKTPEYEKERQLERNKEKEREQERRLSFDKFHGGPLEDNAPPAKNSITKLVANNKFALNFTTNADMEKKIEQATVFTGPFLKEIREYKNIDVNRMSEMTRVSKTYILGIEAEDPTKLPAFVYIRGFVYQYAKCLKLNPDLVATSYMNYLKSKKS